MESDLGNRAMHATSVSWLLLLPLPFGLALALALPLLYTTCAETKAVLDFFLLHAIDRHKP